MFYQKIQLGSVVIHLGKENNRRSKNPKEKTFKGTTKEWIKIIITIGVLIVNFPPIEYSIGGKLKIHRCIFCK